MPKHVADIAIKELNRAGKVIRDSKVLILGLTYKENVPDTRESPAGEMVHELKEFDVDVYGYDPLLGPGGDRAVRGQASRVVAGARGAGGLYCY
jgi:UDPglucose 6-dehydrogenase/UDP-N-acetyl-D-galactosamine dehydrogenase